MQVYSRFDIVNSTVTFPVHFHADFWSGNVTFFSCVILFVLCCLYQGHSQGVWMVQTNPPFKGLFLLIIQRVNLSQYNTLNSSLVILEIILPSNSCYGCWINFL